MPSKGRVRRLRDVKSTTGTKRFLLLPRLVFLSPCPQTLPHSFISTNSSYKNSILSHTDVHVEERQELYLSVVPGMSLSGPFLLEISVKSLRILAAFLASDFRLDGMGLLTANTQITSCVIKTLSASLRRHFEIGAFLLRFGRWWRTKVYLAGPQREEGER